MTEQEEEEKIDPHAPRPWYFRNATLVTGFFLLYLFVLPLVWYNPFISSSRKVMLSFIALVVSALLIKILMFLLMPQ